MISRLVLVGIVGALGVSFPTQSEQSEWLAAARAWAVGQLARWDLGAPGGPACPTSSPDNAGSPKTGAFEPIAPDVASVENDLAYRLIRLTEADPVRPIAKTVKAAETVKTIVPDVASVENDLAYQLVLSTDIQVDPVDDAANALAVALNRWADGTAIQPPAALTMMAPAPKFEPIATPEGPEWGVAGQLNRMADGLAPAAKAGASGSTTLQAAASPTNSTGIGAALRLTRDAACAWMTVLTGPAVVHVSPR